MNDRIPFSRFFLISFLLLFLVSSLGSQTLLLNENFATTTSMQLHHEAEASATISNGKLILSGGSASLWTGTGNNTTYSNAFTDNFFHRASVSKLIEAESYNGLQLQITMRQKAATHIKNTWMRVMINGQAIPDVNAKLYHNPLSLSNDSMQTLVYNLDAYSGSEFILSIQASCKIYENDAVWIDAIQLIGSSYVEALELPYSESFNSGDFPTYWSMTNDSGSHNWQLGQSTQLSGTGIYFFSINIPGDGFLTSNRLNTAAFNFLYQSAISLNFNYALQGSAYLLASLNNGQSWPDTVHVFTTNGGSWQNTSISLAAYQGQSSVRFAFHHSDVSDNASIFALDQFSLSSQNSSTADGGISTFLTPVQQTLYSNTQQVSVRVKNYGSTPISQVTVNYQVNQGTINTQILAGPLQAGDSTTLIFNSTYDLGTIGTYQFKAWSEIPYDVNHLNDTVFRTVIVSNPIVSTFPYIESFEANHHWQDYGLNNDWELTLPAGSVISSASDGVKAWVTNPSGVYGNYLRQYVMSPVFNFTGLTNPQLELDFICHTEQFEDGANLQYSLDQGNTWSSLGAMNDPINWYNSSFIAGLSQSGSLSGWTGTYYSAWTTASRSLSILAGQPSVRFRIFFGSEFNFGGWEGFAFDKFIIRDLQTYDPGIVSIEYPTSNCELGASEPIVVKVKNYGVNSISSFTLSYSLDGLNYINETVNQTLTSGSELLYSFTQLANFTSSGGYELHIALSHPLDGFSFNNQLQISVNYEDDKPLPYLENFEAGGLPAGWARSNMPGAEGWLITTDYMSTYFPIPPHTTYAAANDDSCYCNAANDLLISPYFDLTWYTTFTLSFEAYFTGLFNSSAVVLVSTDCGYTWDEVYFVPTNTVNWQTRTVNLNAYAGEPKVKIAFKHDDNNGWASGFAIDNVSFTGTTASQQQQLSLNQGWGIISTYIQPYNASPIAVFAPVVSNLIILKNENGQVYWPGFGVDAINLLQIGKGYQILMNAPASLTITGTQAQPQNTPIQLNSNWNLIGYLRTSPMSVVSAFSSIVNSVAIAKDENGNVYWPLFGVNGITNLNPGKGYQVKMTAPAILTYPAN
jgi:hypothetical protein